MTQWKKDMKWENSNSIRSFTLSQFATLGHGQLWEGNHSLVSRAYTESIR